MPKLTKKEFDEIVNKYGICLKYNFNPDFFRFITGTTKEAFYFFEYCGIKFRLKSINNIENCVIIEKMPFEIAVQIYEEYPKNPYGICYTFDERSQESNSPYMGVTDSEHEEKLSEILFAREEDWVHLLAEATDVLSHRQDSGKYLRGCKVYSKEGLDLILTKLKKRIDTLEKWASVYEVDLPKIQTDIREKLTSLDGILSLENEIQDTNNYSDKFMNSFKFSTFLQYEIERGKVFVLEHGYSKGDINNMSGEYVKMQLIENDRLVNEVIYNLSHNKCLKLDSNSSLYEESKITEVDMKELSYILNESIYYYGDEIRRNGNHKRS